MPRVNTLLFAGGLAELRYISLIFGDVGLRGKTSSAKVGEPAILVIYSALIPAV